MRAAVQQPAVSMNANRNMADSMIGKYSLTQIVCTCHAKAPQPLEPRPPAEPPGPWLCGSAAPGRSAGAASVDRWRLVPSSFAVRSSLAHAASASHLGNVPLLTDDPLNLQSTFDNNWLREAELKHGRLCMLAIVGFLANDAGFKFPGPKFEGLASIDAHDKMVETGHMWFLLFFVGVCESAHASVVIPRLDGDWSGYEPGNYGLDPWKLDTPSRREAELKNGRLAMIAFSGMITQGTALRSTARSPATLASRIGCSSPSDST